MPHDEEAHNVDDTHRAVEGLVSFVLTLLLALTSSMVLYGSRDPQPRILVLTYGAFAALFAVALPPRSWATTGDLLLWSCAIGVAAGLPSLAIRNVDFAHALLLSLGVALLVFSFSTIRCAIAQWRSEEFAAIATITIFVTLAAAPLYLGPAAEIWSEQRWIANTATNVSPLSHLAAALEFDYLRASWFYEHSRVGSLRFDYFSPAVSTVTWSLIAVATSLLTHLHPHSRRNQPS